MLTEEDRKLIKSIRDDQRHVKDEEIVRDITAILDMAEMYLIRLRAKEIL